MADLIQADVEAHLELLATQMEREEVARGPGAAQTAAKLQGEQKTDFLLEGLEGPRDPDPSVASITKFVKPAKTAGAPAEARKIASFAANSTEYVRGIQLGLKQTFGTDVELRVRDNKLQFLNFESGKFEDVDPTGLDFGDLADLTGDAIVAAGGISTTSVAAVSGVGGPAVGLAGAIGSAIGEYTRLKIGQSHGLNLQFTDAELAGKAAFVFGLDLAAAGIPGAALFITKTGNAVAGKFSAGGAARLMAQLEAGKELEVEFLETTAQLSGMEGRKLLLNSGQIGDPSLAKTGRELIQQPEGEALLARVQEQQLNLRGVSEDVIQTEQTVATDEIGRVVKIETGKTVKGRRARVEAFKEKSVAAAQAEARELENLTTDLSIAGRTVREDLQKWVDNNDKRFDLQYEELFRDARFPDKRIGIVQDNKTSLFPLKLAAASRKIQQQKNLLSKLGEEDQRLVNEAFNAQKTANFEEIQATIGALRRARIVARDNPAVPSADVKTLTTLIHGLQEARGELAHKFAQQGHPEFATRLSEIEGQYRQFRDQIRSTTIGRLLKRGEGGVLEVTDSRVFNNLLESVTTGKKRDPLTSAQAIMDIFEEEGMQDGIVALQRGVSRKYFEEVVDKTTNVVNPGKHETFMKRFKPLVETFFKGDIKQFDNPVAFARTMEQVEKRAQQTIGALNKKLGTTLAGLDAGAIIGRTWGADKTSQVRFVKSILSKRHPEIWEAYKSRVLLRDANKLGEFQGTGFMLKSGKMGEYIASHREVLEITHGKEFIKNLESLRRAFAAVEQDTLAGISRVGDDTIVKAAYDLARIYTGQFTAPGRALTAFRRVRGRAANRAIADAIADPEKLAQLVKLNTLSSSSRAARVIFSQFGAYSLVIPPSSDDPDLNQVILDVGSTSPNDTR